MTQTADFSLTLERLWQFSLQYYAVRGVKEACLTLQNRYQGNVNLLLLLKWLDEQSLTFDQQEWPKMQACIQRTEELLMHYRTLRKKVKNHLPSTLYRESLQFELLLEKQQQSDLVDCLNELNLTEKITEPLTADYCRQLGAEQLIEAFSKPSV